MYVGMNKINNKNETWIYKMKFFTDFFYFIYRIEGICREYQCQRWENKRIEEFAENNSWYIYLYVCDVNGKVQVKLLAEYETGKENIVYQRTNL